MSPGWITFWVILGFFIFVFIKFGSENKGEMKNE